MAWHLYLFILCCNVFVDCVPFFSSLLLWYAFFCNWFIYWCWKRWNITVHWLCNKHVWTKKQNKFLPAQFHFDRRSFGFDVAEISSLVFDFDNDAMLSCVFTVNGWMLFSISKRTIFCNCVFAVSCWIVFSTSKKVMCRLLFLQWFVEFIFRCRKRWRVECEKRALLNAFVDVICWMHLWIYAVE